MMVVLYYFQLNDVIDDCWLCFGLAKYYKLEIAYLIVPILGGK
jgi:hypothetical protein